MLSQSPGLNQGEEYKLITPSVAPAAEGFFYHYYELPASPARFDSEARRANLREYTNRYRKCYLEYSYIRTIRN